MSGLPVASPRRTAARASAAWYVAPAAAFLSAGAGYVHLAYMQSHWRDWWAYGAFFLAAGVFQLLYGPVLLRRPGPKVVLLGIAGNLAVVGMYVYSRTEGVPLGPHARVKEAAGAVDVATTAAEILVVALLLALAGGRSRRWTLNLLLVAGLALWVMRLGQGFG